MFVPFDTLPDDARIWIYPSNRKFSEQEEQEIQDKCQHFIENWSAHGTGLQASFTLAYNRFVIFAVDQDIQASTGCSIDASVHFIQQLEKDYQIDLLDKMNVTFKNGPHLAHKSLIDFKKMAKEKAVSGSTIVFNNLVNTVGEWREFWEVPAEESWHSRFF
jgi:hypothetical protein